MKWVWFALRILLLVIVFPFFNIVFIAGLVLFSFHTKYKLFWRNFIVQWWSRALLFIMNAHVKVEGTLPQPPFFLVSNHLGYLDILVYFSVLHCVFVSRHDVANWPLIGPIARSLNTLFIDRTRRADIPRVNKQIIQAMKVNKGLIIFPEGTSTGGKDVLPFKPSLLEYAARNSFPISYATVHYKVGPNDPPAQRSVCYWSDMHFASHLLNLLKLSRIDITIRFGEETIRSNDRKEIAVQAWEKVNSQFIPVYVENDL